MHGPGNPTAGRFLVYLQHCPQPLILEYIKLLVLMTWIQPFTTSFRPIPSTRRIPPHEPTHQRRRLFTFSVPQDLIEL